MHYNSPMSKEYVQIAFNFDNQDQFELLVAQLSNIGFDGFNEEEAATGINNGVGMSSVLGSTAGLGAGLAILAGLALLLRK